MKIFLIIIGLFFCNLLIAQNQAIRITNIRTNKEKIFRENTRIKLKTCDGQKIKGRFRVENESTIVIDNTRIDLSDLDAVKRNPLLTSILTSGFFICGGAFTAYYGVIIGAFAVPAAFWVTIPAAGMIYTGIKPPNINKNHKKAKGWKFEVITISD